MLYFFSLSFFLYKGKFDCRESSYRIYRTWRFDLATVPRFPPNTMNDYPDRGEEAAISHPSILTCGNLSPCLFCKLPLTDIEMRYASKPNCKLERWETMRCEMKDSEQHSYTMQETFAWTRNLGSCVVVGCGRPRQGHGAARCGLCAEHSRRAQHDGTAWRHSMREHSEFVVSNGLW